MKMIKVNNQLQRNEEIWLNGIDIPVDITRYILTFIDVEDVSITSQCCKLFNDILDENSFWKIKCGAQYGGKI